jgi:hypothetical protein
LKCIAAGQLIPNNLYNPDFEGKVVDDENYGEIRDLFEELGHDLDLLKELQEIHDQAAITANEDGIFDQQLYQNLLEENWKELAEEQGLIYDE